MFKYCLKLILLDILVNYFKLKENEFIKMIKNLKNFIIFIIRNIGLYYFLSNLICYLLMLRKFDVLDNYLNGLWDGNFVFGNVLIL